MLKYLGLKYHEVAIYFQMVVQTPSTPQERVRWNKCDKMFKTGESRVKVYGWYWYYFNVSVGLNIFTLIFRYYPEQDIWTQVVSINYQDTIPVSCQNVLVILQECPDRYCISCQYPQRGKCSKWISYCLLNAQCTLLLWLVCKCLD